MSIRTKVILVLSAVVFVYLGLSFSVLRAFVYSAFDDLEAEQAGHDRMRIEHALHEIGAHLESLNVEWSQWNETYYYLLGKNERFLTDELLIFEHNVMGIDAAILCNRDGRIIWEKAADPETGKPFAVAEIFQDPLRSLDELIVRTSAAGSVFGLIRTGRGPALVAARPVYDSKGNGPPAGILVFARILDAARLDALRLQTQVEFSVLTAADLTSQAAHAEDDRSSPRLALESPDVEYRVTDGPLVDIYGEPAFQLRVRTPRHITAIGSRAIMTSLISLVLGGVVVTVAVWIILQRMIIAPIGNLTRSMLTVAKELGEPDQRNAHEEHARSATG